MTYSQIYDLCAELDRIDRRMAMLADTSSVENKIEQLETENTALRAENENKTIQIQQYFSEVAKLKEIVQNLRAELVGGVKEKKQLQAENKRLKVRERLLDALEAAGVDNWDGYDEAMDILSKP